jgi:hypothetical protein
MSSSNADETTNDNTSVVSGFSRTKGPTDRGVTAEKGERAWAIETEAALFRCTQVGSPSSLKTGW